MSRTERNLKDAFSGESQANRKYLAFARKAEEEGLAQVARLFRSAAGHVGNHLRALGAVGSCAGNLQGAFGGERAEFTVIYPRMIGDAEAEGRKDAGWIFRRID